MGFAAFLQREWLTFGRSKLDLWMTLLPPMITSVFFVLSMAANVGKVNGVPYAVFILPGIAMMSVVGSASSFAGRLFNEGFSAVLVQYFTLPATRSAYVAAKIVAGVTMSLLQGALFLIVGSLLLGIPIQNLFVWEHWLALLFGASTFSMGFLCLALAIREMGTFLVSLNVVSQLLIWSAAVFYPLESMPGILGIFGRWNPLTHAVSLLRGQTVGNNPWISWIYLGGLCLFCGIFAVRVLRRRAERSI
jgi:ABC-type multidrug transport system permease subunit